MAEKAAEIFDKIERCVEAFRVLQIHLDFVDLWTGARIRRRRLVSRQVFSIQPVLVCWLRSRPVWSFRVWPKLYSLQFGWLSFTVSHFKYWLD